MWLVYIKTVRELGCITNILRELAFLAGLKVLSSVGKENKTFQHEVFLDKTVIYVPLKILYLEIDVEYCAHLFLLIIQLLPLQRLNVY